jgi:hypothetical protein
MSRAIAISRASARTKHINIHGPAASGKTRYAELFRKHYGCTTVIDEGKLHSAREMIDLRGPGPHLVLTQEPIRAPQFRNVPIRTALFCIGKVL